MKLSTYNLYDFYRSEPEQDEVGGYNCTIHAWFKMDESNNNHPCLISKVAEFSAEDTIKIADIIVEALNNYKEE